MTRDQMLSALESTLVELPEDALENPSVAAEIILKRLERLGMKPPPLPSKYCQAIMNIYMPESCDFNQWEEDIGKDSKITEWMEKWGKR